MMDEAVWHIHYIYLAIFDGELTLALRIRPWLDLIPRGHVANVATLA